VGPSDIRNKLKLALDPDRACIETEDLSFSVTKWFIPTVRLPQDIKPKLIKAYELSQDITISRKCKINENNKEEKFWWEVTQSVYKGQSNEDNGVVFFTYSEKVVDSLIGYR
jgi:GTP-sensing pleiotropic transcriptional regulator CodY